MATERRQRSANGYSPTLPELKWWRRYVLLFCAGVAVAWTGVALRWDWLGESGLLVFLLPLVFTLRSTAVGKNRHALYAIHDTHMALLESKRKGITPFCMTVDRYGHDYLKQMCADIGYAVVPDIESLPSRITTLYRELTA